MAYSLRALAAMDTTSAHPRRVVFLSTRNAARSLMAEAWLNHLGHGAFLAESAGTHPADRVEPLAAQVMHEAGIDIHHARPRGLRELSQKDYDMAIVLGPLDVEQPGLEAVPEVCTWAFNDPTEGPSGENESERAKRFYRLRDELRTRVSLFVNANTEGIPTPTSGIARSAPSAPARAEGHPPRAE